MKKVMVKGVKEKKTVSGTKNSKKLVFDHIYYISWNERTEKKMQDSKNKKGS